MHTKTMYECMNDACLAKCNLNTDVLQKHKVIIVMSLATINMCSLVSSLHYYIVTSVIASFYEPVSFEILCSYDDMV